MSNFNKRKSHNKILLKKERAERRKQEKQIKQECEKKYYSSMIHEEAFKESKIYAEFLEKEGYKNYIRNMCDGAPRIVAGMIVPAVVVRKTESGTVVYVEGAEAILQDSYTSRGVSFYVVVSNIRKEEYVVEDKKYNIIRLDASQRQAEKIIKDTWIGYV